MGRRAYGDALERHASALARAGIAALNLREAEWSLGLVTLAHRFGLLAFAWDAQEYRRIRAVLEMGVDGIYSDHVERLVAAVGEWSGRQRGYTSRLTLYSRLRSLSGQILTKARPTIECSSIDLKNVESRESWRLSPSTHTRAGGTFSGGKSRERTSGGR